MQWLGWTLTCALAMTASAALTGAGAFQYLLAGRQALPGTWVEGHAYDPALHPDVGEWLEGQRQRLLERPIYLTTQEEVFEYRFGDLGLELDVADALGRLERQVRTGDPWQRVLRALEARRGLVEQPVRYSVDFERARAQLRRLAPRVHRPAVNAKLDVRNHRRIESAPGRALDIEATLHELRRVSLEQTPLLAAAQLPIEPEVTTEMLADIDVSKVLASFETSFRNKAGSRAVNIRRAAEFLNGYILAPGAVLSFNQVVGPREAHRGFTLAPVIVKDEMEEDLGGGVCQVATTLHAAAVYGLLDVEERRSHSRPSGYAPLGLDATVIYGKVDLKLRNPYQSALMVHAYLPSRYTIRVELLGREPPGQVTHAYAVTEKYDFVRRVASKPFLEPGEHRRRQKGTPGYDVVSVVKIEYDDGKVDRHTYRSKYYPVPEVYWIAEGSDPNELPELPEGATHTEHVDDTTADEEPGLAGDAQPLRG